MIGLSPHEGTGVVNLVIDQFGSITLSFPQGGTTITLNDMTVS